AQTKPDKVPKTKLELEALVLAELRAALDCGARCTSRSFPMTTTACLLPGTEIAFDGNVESESSFDIGILPNKKIGQRLARFRQVNMNNSVAHHDALEFPDGQVILVTRLCAGQRATVLQLPAGARAAPAEGTVVEPQLFASPRFRSYRADGYALIDGVQYKEPLAQPVACNWALAIFT